MAIDKPDCVVVMETDRRRSTCRPPPSLHPYVATCLCDIFNRVKDMGGWGRQDVLTNLQSALSRRGQS